VITLRALVILTLFTLCGVARSGDDLRDHWLSLIQAEVGCAVKINRVGTATIGNNGYREEQWFLQSCAGAIEYYVEYFPKQAFPDRKSPYEVRRHHRG
jgi:hypothetical protein